MSVIKKGKEKLMKIAEIVHLKFFGHPMSDTMREFLGNLSWSFFGGIIAAGILFVVNIIAGRILGPEEYGKYALVVAMANIFIIPMTFGLDVATTHYVARSNNKNVQKKYISSTISMFIILLFITIINLYFFRTFLARLFSAQVYAVEMAIFFAGLLVIKNIFDASIKGLKLFKYQSLVKIIEATTIVTVLFTFCLLLSQLSFVNYLEAIMVGYFVFIILIFFKIIKYFRFSFIYKGQLLMYGFYAMIGSVNGVLLNSFDKIFINKYIGQEQLGIYNAYYMSSVIVISQIVVIFVNVFFSQTSSLKNKKIVLEKINKLAKVLFFPMFIVLMGVISLLVVLFGDKYPFDFILVLEFDLLSVITFYFAIIWWLIASQGLRGIRFTAMHGILTGLIFTLLNLLFKNVLTIHQVVIFLILSLFYGIVIGNWKGVKLKQ